MLIDASPACAECGARMVAGYRHYPNTDYSQGAVMYHYCPKCRPRRIPESATMPQDAIEGDNMTDDTSAPPKPTEGEILAGLVAGGLSRREAFTVLCIHMGARSVTITGDDDASPQLEEMRQQVMALQEQAVRSQRQIDALVKTLVPAYLTLDDVGQILNKAEKGGR